MGIGVADGVDETADSVRAVKERRWTAHHFDAGRLAGLSVHTMVRLTDLTDHPPLAVLENQHAIPVETANDGT